MLPDQLMESGIGRGSMCQTHLPVNWQIKQLGGSYTLPEALKLYNRLIHYRCKKGCVGRCKCDKAALKCTAL